LEQDSARIIRQLRLNVSVFAPVLTMQLVPLKLMACGEYGKVHDVDGSPEFVVRLQELGLQEGAEVQMVKTGSPCILAINKQRFSLRFDEQATVLVEVAR
jgi:ferrous iron transport protein A